MNQWVNDWDIYKYSGQIQATIHPWLVTPNVWFRNLSAPQNAKKIQVKAIISNLQRSHNPSYPSIKPFVGVTVITPFPPWSNLKRIMVHSQQMSTFFQVARTVIAPVERVALIHRMWRWMGRAGCRLKKRFSVITNLQEEGASMSILSARWAPTIATNGVITPI